MPYCSLNDTAAILSAVLQTSSSMENNLFSRCIKHPGHGKMVIIYKGRKRGQSLTNVLETFCQLKKQRHLLGGSLYRRKNEERCYGVQYVFMSQKVKVVNVTCADWLLRRWKGDFLLEYVCSLGLCDQILAFSPWELCHGTGKNVLLWLLLVLTVLNLEHVFP